MITLAYPYTTLINTLELHNPIIGDIIKITNNVDYLLSENGNVTNTKKDQLLQIALTFVNLTNEQIDDILIFIGISDGSFVQYTDKDSTIFKAHILSQHVVSHNHRERKIFNILMNAIRITGTIILATEDSEDLITEDGELILLEAV